MAIAAYSPITAKRPSNRAIRRVHIVVPLEERGSRMGECHTALHHPDTVILDPMPAYAPPGMTWCPICLGRYAARIGALDAVAGTLIRLEQLGR